MADFLNVREVLRNLALAEGMSAAEFGCGSAIFATTLSRLLKKGHVYALDVQEEKISALNGRLAKEHIGNVSGIVCDLEAPGGSTLADAALDVVLIPNMLFQTENRYGILEEASRILKSGGQLLVVDWLKKGPFSPPAGMIAPEQVREMAAKLPLKMKKEFAAGDYHYGLLFVKL